mmetsp:Transcript_18206/g.28341  ORF Transcript_18206/g.28341 Transcript_18206/m.28341 type:complete len:223 (-) Transcript_18206:2606-3274(-)
MIRCEFVNRRVPLLLPCAITCKTFSNFAMAPLPAPPLANEPSPGQQVDSYRLLFNETLSINTFEGIGDASVVKLLLESLLSRPFVSSQSNSISTELLRLSRPLTLSRFIEEVSLQLSSSPSMFIFVISRMVKVDFLLRRTAFPMSSPSSESPSLLTPSSSPPKKCLGIFRSKADIMSKGYVANRLLAPVDPASVRLRSDLRARIPQETQRHSHINFRVSISE